MGLDDGWKCCMSFLLYTSVIVLRLVQIWQHVKNANPSMSVCEVGASIGRLWREMSDADKQLYNDDFSREKVDSHVD